MIKGYAISTHLIKERADRVAAIAQYIGFGEIKYRFEKENKIEAITTTGILIVLDKQEKLIVTMYVPGIDKVFSLFGGNVPREVKLQAEKNLKNKGYAKYA